jgi:hypothetical protein
MHSGIRSAYTEEAANLDAVGGKKESERLLPERTTHYGHIAVH